MTRINRRAFMGGVGLAGLAGVLAACGGESAPPSPGNTGGGGDAVGGGGAGGTFTWWDHFGGLQDLHAQWAADEGSRLGVTIEYTYNEPGKATEALQLA